VLILILQQTRQAITNVLEMKGNPEDLNTFIKCDTQEAKTAAYLHFSDIGAFRRVKLSFPVIEAWAHMEAAGPAHETLY